MSEHAADCGFRQVGEGKYTSGSALEGQKTLISRTMHALEYDPVHDELIVNSPLNKAILTFRGGAKGEEAPVRMIMGPHTQIQGTAYDGNDKMAMDP